MADANDRQLQLFDPDVELSAMGITREQLERWRDSGFISFDPDSRTLERWMLQEAAFIHHLTKIEWSVNAIRQLLLPLKPPYLLDHGRHFFNFKELQWQRRYIARDLLEAAALEDPQEIGYVIHVLIRCLARAGAHDDLMRVLAVVRETLQHE